MRLVLISAFFLTIGFNVAFAADIPVDCEKYANNDRVCLACNIYYEARNQSEPGQYAVAHVTINRIKSAKYPDTICKVVWETRRHYKTKKLTPMFSWTLDGKSDVVQNAVAWRRALTVADAVLSSLKAGMNFDITYGATHYHADYVKPAWAKAFTLTNVIGHHLFYTEPVQTAKVQ